MTNILLAILKLILIATGWYLIFFLGLGLSVVNALAFVLGFAVVFGAAAIQIEGKN